MMKRTLVITLLSLMLVISACAQSKQSRSLPRGSQSSEATAPATVDQIFDRYVEAIGGADAFRRFTSLAFKGTFEFPETGVKGAIESYAKAPNKYLFSMRTPDDSLFTIVGFDGTVGWQRTLLLAEDRIDLREMRGAELVESKFNSDLYQDFKMKERYSRKLLKGTQKVDDREAYVIEATSATGNPETMYFDKQTGLLLRRDAFAVDPQGEKRRRETYYDDYKMVKDCKFTHTANIIYPDHPDRNTIIRYNQILTNVDLPDSVFDKPRK